MVRDSVKAGGMVGGGPESAGTNGSFASESTVSDGIDECMRLRVQPSMPCALGGCGRPAFFALAERNPDHPGLWSLLPVCAECSALLHDASAHPQVRPDQTLRAGF